MQKMKVSLIAMPWPLVDLPSVSLGVLSAFVRREEPQWQVECRHEYVDVARLLGRELYHRICESDGLAEAIYACMIYPEQRGEVEARFNAATDGEQRPEFAQVLAALEEHVEVTAKAVAGADAVGLSAIYHQLFPSLALARRIKALAPQTAILFGGAAVRGTVAASILAEYPFVDYVVQGEGEVALLKVLRALRGGEPVALEAVLDRGNHQRRAGGAKTSEFPSHLDGLPTPEYDDFFARVEGMDVTPILPVEGSRGCWWDRSRRTGDPRDRCTFCSINCWSSYRARSARRVADELAQLSQRHSTVRFFFTDSVPPVHGLIEIGEAIAALGRDLEFSFSLRANTSPYEFLKLREAGMRYCQIGIEALSNSYLKRLGKGATVIQNLQAMKSCYELGILNVSPLIVDFPGSTAEEVEETVHHLTRYAICYSPMTIAPFQLGLGSTVEELANDYQLVHLRNHDRFRAGLPEAVWQRLKLYDLSYEREEPGVDWGPVVEASHRWIERHRQLHEATFSVEGRNVDPQPLFYKDGGTFLRIWDRRVADEERDYCLDADARELYLYACTIRSMDQLVRRFARLGEAAVREQVEQLVEAGLVFREGGRLLALAVAARPEAAARRIREERQQTVAASAAKTAG